MAKKFSLPEMVRFLLGLQTEILKDTKRGRIDRVAIHKREAAVVSKKIAKAAETASPGEKLIAHDALEEYRRNLQ